MLIYYAGCEGEATHNILKLGKMKDVFLSYYYLRSMPKAKVERILTTVRRYCKNIIIDSGAHSFLSEEQDDGISLSASMVKKHSKTKETKESYINRYIQRVKNYHGYFDYFVELDIGEIVGQDQVLKRREEVKVANIYNQCITVRHPAVVSDKEYDEMLDDSESGYIALEGDRKVRKRLPYLKYLKKAIEKGIKVHGFAQTKKDIMYYYPFYSVDSTSRMTPVQYGSGITLTKNGIQGIAYKTIDILKTKNASILEFSKKPNVQALYRLQKSIDAYNTMAAYYTSLRKARGIDWDKIILDFKKKDGKK